MRMAIMGFTILCKNPGNLQHYTYLIHHPLAVDHLTIYVRLCGVERNKALNGVGLFGFLGRG